MSSTRSASQTDVYKRQRYIRGLGLISSDSENAKTYYHYVCDEQGSVSRITVSYTHLDVYKRQKDDRVAALFCNKAGYDMYDAHPFVLEGGAIHTCLLYTSPPEFIMIPIKVLKSIFRF